MIDKFQIGKVYRVQYPTNCLLNGQPEFRPREILVTGFRDLLTDPLTIDEYLRRPLLRRSRWIVKVRSPHIPRHYRQFYLNNVREYWHTSPLKIGWYDPSQPGTRPLATVPLILPSTAVQRMTLAKTLAAWRDHQDPDGLVLRVFCDDLNVRRVG